MSNDNDKEANNSLMALFIDKVFNPAFITALTALVVALGFGFHNKSVGENHGEAIQKIEKKADDAAQDADIAKDKASIVENKVEKIERAVKDK